MLCPRCPKKRLRVTHSYEITSLTQGSMTRALRCPRCNLVLTQVIITANIDPAYGEGAAALKSLSLEGMLEALISNGTESRKD